MTATRISSSSSGTGLPAGWVSVKDAPYGALGDGSTDDSTAIQAAITAVKAAGGVVYFPPGTYMVGTTLNADSNAKSFSLRGPGGGAEHGLSAATLVYTGTTGGATGGLITFNSSFAFEVAYLGLDYNNASFAGNVVNIDGNIHAADSADFHIHHCTSRARNTNTANSIIRMHKAIIGTIDYCHLTGADTCIQYSDTTATSYVVSVVAEKCTFNFARTAFIGLYSGDGESLTWRDCTFEAGINTPAFKGGAATRLYKPLIEGCWYGDASGTVIWIDGLCTQSNLHVGTIRDNAFFLSGTVNDVAMKLGCTDASNNCGTWLVEGNTVLGSGNAFDSYTSANFRHVIAIANSYVSLTNVWKTGTAYPSTYVSIGNDGEADSIGRLGLTNKTNSPNVEATDNAGETLALAATCGAATNAFPTLPAGRNAVFSHFGTSFVPRLVLQGAVDSGSEVVLGAGASPVKTVWVKDAKLGFYDTTPVVKAGAITTPNTQTAAYVQADVASLKTAIDSIRTVLQNLGLTA